ncbi:MAG: hypothetical protein HQM10_08900 [Candidatus Riflebacteria bacterium]|nr:hypothetical protein [Candidatus Riflebacteria bacterium]
MKKIRLFAFIILSLMFGMLAYAEDILQTSFSKELTASCSVVSFFQRNELPPADAAIIALGFDGRNATSGPSLERFAQKLSESLGRKVITFKGFVKHGYLSKDENWWKISPEESTKNVEVAVRNAVDKFPQKKILAFNLDGFDPAKLIDKNGEPLFSFTNFEVRLVCGDSKLFRATAWYLHETELTQEEVRQYFGRYFTIQTTGRRQLRVALYPYVPQSAEMYWKLETEFEDLHPDIDLRYVELGVEYYSGQLLEAVRTSRADVFEVDTIFLRDLVDEKLIQELPADVLSPKDTFLQFACDSSMIDGKIYGVPHWLCGDLIFFRKDDPDHEKFEKLTSLNGLELIIGNSPSKGQGLLANMKGRSTIGGKYLDAMLDIYQTPDKTLKHVFCPTPDVLAINSLKRLSALRTGDDNSDKCNAKHFAHRKSRALLGYSEHMYYVVDEFINGISSDEAAVGSFSFVFNDTKQINEPVGAWDIDVVSAPMADNGSKPLARVDALTIRSGVDSAKRRDALELISFFNSEKFTAKLLIPEFGNAPRYLLPARNSLYTNPDLLRAAPLYSKFHEIMKHSITLSASKLCEKIRTISKYFR